MSLQIPRLGSKPICTTASGCNVDAGAATFDTTEVAHCIFPDGLTASAAAQTNTALSAGHTTLTAGQMCFFVVTVSRTGAVATSQGPIFKAGVDATGAASYVNITPVQTATDPYPPGTKNSTYQSDFLPVLADTLCPIGIIYVYARTASFIPGTTNFDATGISSGAMGVSFMPYQTNITPTLVG